MASGQTGPTRPTGFTRTEDEPPPCLHATAVSDPRRRRRTTAGALYWIRFPPVSGSELRRRRSSRRLMKRMTSSIFLSWVRFGNHSSSVFPIMILWVACDPLTQMDRSEAFEVRWRWTTTVFELPAS